MALTGSALAYKVARAGVARAGASRSNYVTGLTARITINGTDRSSAIRKDSISITQNLNEQVDTCTLRTRGVTAFTPTAGHVITIGLGDASDNLLFGGRIQAVTVVGDIADKPGTWSYELFCVDYTWQASKRLVLKRYLSTSATDIVADLLTLYTSGLTRAHVQTGLASVDDITFTLATVPEALTRLAERVGGYWYIDYTGDVHFFLTEVRPSPATLSASSAWKWRNLRVRTDLSQIRTRAYVEGRGGTLNAKYDAQKFYLDTPSEIFADPGAGTYDVRVRTVVVPYTDVVDAAPGHLLTNAAAEATINASLEQFPREYDEVNTWVERNDTSAQTALAALEGGDGIREHYIQDRRLNYAGAVDRGDAELTLYADPMVTVTYDTQDVNARPGGEVTISVTSPVTISGTYRIQTVEISDLELSATQWPWRRVTASSVRYDFYDVLRRRVQGN